MLEYNCLNVNEMQNCLPHGRLIRYADAQLFDSSHKDNVSMVSLKNRLEESLVTIEKWLRASVTTLKCDEVWPVKGQCDWIEFSFNPPMPVTWVGYGSG